MCFVRGFKKELKDTKVVVSFSERHLFTGKAYARKFDEHIAAENQYKKTCSQKVFSRSKENIDSSILNTVENNAILSV